MSMITRRYDNDRRRQRLSIDCPAAPGNSTEDDGLVSREFRSRSLVAVVSSFSSGNNAEQRWTLFAGKLAPRHSQNSNVFAGLASRTKSFSTTLVTLWKRIPVGPEEVSHFLDKEREREGGREESLLSFRGMICTRSTFSFILLQNLSLRSA